MSDWLSSALDYIPTWIDYQRELFDQPGVSLAIAHKGQVLLEHASGMADLATREPLTPRHRFRVASHSKTFTAAGIMLLRERNKIRLDDRLGEYLVDLTLDVSDVTISQLLSHAAGLTRDGPDSGQFSDRRPFLSEAEFRTDLSAPQPLAPGVTFKYSNHGFALLGKVIEKVTGEPYGRWIYDQVVVPVGLTETTPDFDPSVCCPLARGHSTRQPYGRRFVIPGDNVTNDMASATGFTATAGDLARFLGQLSPGAQSSILTVASRREMTRRHWRDAHSQLERYYGLGTISGPPGPWSWVGHAGGFQGTLTRTVALPEQDIAISVLTNAIDGLANVWFESVIHILKAIHDLGAPGPETARWRGRWWTLWGPFDLVPGNDKVLVATPGQLSPFLDATELKPSGIDEAIVTSAQAFGDLGEACRLMRNSAGIVEEVGIGGKRLVTEDAIRSEVQHRYQPSSRAV
ncbi:D-alanyl-D-alanine carboxypeptidase [Bradyrhizobium japonicum]|jgi:CubicO group peptidase (beta-lactamase class C family)|uniref:D-alanyl-D-alanine carboxypeptidase n=1 Tax=Bradyrhizobium elkanii TaxID=29448 RepID=A0ABV4FAH5_BRAEL|nr:serine hydrolase domain-containing protein [Bradyrhizobium elkanii]MBP2432514.1 CubicO group peptidase (beta-lactamase class C family) [Bradyrhizobium elkanii]MCP1734170.1 CubicO group peptidase (beta-lactamase class C family) [Bradyrhizobium elkanii]MCP1751852.1 CubicO group peptidase (beta-lactamase class C family) [Bradyrhizobium elkanii]MCP1966860.1 CubicO group peptidase (beta-lactamase class C family) [Bradyrhizobium elkanii]MCP1977623.1 CubicO group peptidase (beta-lactamase class C 